MPFSMTRSKRDAEHAPGRRGTERERPAGRRSKAILDQRRAEILSVAERLFERDGADSFSIAEVCAAAGIDKRGVAELFGDTAGMLAALFQQIVSRLGAKMAEVYAGQEVWVDAIRAALLELLAFVDENPQLAQFLIVRSLQGNSAMLASRQEALVAIAQTIDRDGPHVSAGPSPPFGAEAVVAAAAAVLHGRLLEDPVPPVRELTGALMAVIVMPYLDASAARQELSRPLPPPRALRSAQSASWQQPGVARSGGMRLTDRTTQVLRAIAMFPGTSNTAIAANVGIADQGQISRMLARLRRLRLIEDRPSQSAGRTSKAWRLTAAGAKLLDDLRSTQLDG